jgi:nitrogen fixation-related uncharacterized protein
MEITHFLIGISCVCLVVGIYFFFVRSRPEEKAQAQE